MKSRGTDTEQTPTVKSFVLLDVAPFFDEPVRPVSVARTKHTSTPTPEEAGANNSDAGV